MLLRSSLQALLSLDALLKLFRSSLEAFLKLSWSSLESSETLKEHNVPHTQMDTKIERQTDSHLHFLKLWTYINLNKVKNYIYQDEKNTVAILRNPRSVPDPFLARVMRRMHSAGLRTMFVYIIFKSYNFLLQVRLMITFFYIFFLIVPKQLHQQLTVKKLISIW